MIQTLHHGHGVLKEKKSLISRNIKVEEPNALASIRGNWATVLTGTLTLLGKQPLTTMTKEISNRILVFVFAFVFSFAREQLQGNITAKKNYFGRRIFKKKMEVLFSRILAPLCQAVRVPFPSLLSVHSFLRPQSSFQHTHIRLSSCPSPLKKCSQGLRYRGNRITFGRETPRFISTIMRQNGWEGNQIFCPPVLQLASG